MTQKRITPPFFFKALLFVVSVLFLALTLQPAEALAGQAKVTFNSAGNGTVSGDYNLDLSTQATVHDSGAIVTLGELRNPDTIQPNTGYVFDYWTADVILYRSRYFLFVDPAPIGYQLTSFSDFYTASDVTLTAHFKRQPAKVTYTTDGYGSVGKQNESVEITVEYPSGTETLPIGKANGTTATPTDSSKYAFDYWTADKPIYQYENDELTTIDAGTKIDSPANYYVSGEVTFTAHFKHLPATVTYTADEHGTVGKGSESIEIDKEYTSGEDVLAVGKPTGTTATPLDSTKYALDYWTADKNVYTYENDALTTIAAGTKLTSPADYYVADDVTFKAHFKQIVGDISYTSAGHGSVSASSEKAVFSEQVIDTAGTKAMAGSPKGVTTNPDEDYMFDYWTASSEVIVSSDLSVITAGNKITNDQLSSIWITGDITFTAHFKAKPVTVSYTTDGNGTVSKTSQSVERASTYPLGSDPSKEITVGQPRYGVDTTANKNYMFNYWTASADVYVLDGSTMQLSVYEAGRHLPNENVELYYVAQDTTYTAHFFRTAYDITYEAASHGAVSPTSERMAVDGTPTGCTITPDDNYEFSHWTANVNVEVASESTEPETGTTTIAAGDPITDEQLKRAVFFSGDPTFTAHFKHLPATVTYTADEHGTVGKGSESIEIDKEYTSGEDVLAVGKPTGTTATPLDSTKYALDYWTADKNVYTYENDALTTIAAGTKLTSPADYYVADDVTFKAHFKQIVGDISYTSAGHGSVSASSEKAVFSEQVIDTAGTKAMAGSPKGVTTNPDEDYMFDYWTASSEVIVSSDLSVITAGNKITNDQLSSIWITGDITFTAHFKAKPVTVSYTTDGNGTVSKTSQSVERASTYPLGSDPSKEITVGQPRYGVDTTANKNYMFNYWTASADVYVLDGSTMQLSVYEAGRHLPNENVELYYVAQDTTYTAHFFRTAYDITYEAASHGAVSPTSERMAVDGTPTGCTITPDDNYEFSHWTANVNVEVASESTEPETGTTTIAAGDPITDEQLKRAVSFSGDPTFTAHFKQISSEADSSNDTDNTGVPSGSSGSNSTGNSGGNPTPATGDTLLGTAVVIFLCTGIATALAALFRRRNYER